jgi:hypothetical protein
VAQKISKDAVALSKVCKELERESDGLKEVADER